jgi:hypothetical protein
MKSNGTIETTQDYGNYEMRTTNGKHEMIFKNTFQDDSEHIRQQKRERDQQDEINRLKKQLKNQQEQEESDKRKHLINTNLPHNRFNPLLQ